MSPWAFEEKQIKTIKHVADRVHRSTLCRKASGVGPTNAFRTTVRIPQNCLVQRCSHFLAVLRSGHQRPYTKWKAASTTKRAAGRMDKIAWRPSRSSCKRLKQSEPLRAYAKDAVLLNVLLSSYQPAWQGQVNSLLTLHSLQNHHLLPFSSLKALPWPHSTHCCLSHASSTMSSTPKNSDSLEARFSRINLLYLRSGGQLFTRGWPLSGIIWHHVASFSPFVSTFLWSFWYLTFLNHMLTIINHLKHSKTLWHPTLPFSLGRTIRGHPWSECSGRPGYIYVEYTVYYVYWACQIQMSRISRHFKQICKFWMALFFHKETNMSIIVMFGHMHTMSLGAFRGWISFVAENIFLSPSPRVLGDDKDISTAQNGQVGPFELHSLQIFQGDLAAVSMTMSFFRSVPKCSKQKTQDSVFFTASSQTISTIHDSIEWMDVHVWICESVHVLYIGPCIIMDRLIRWHLGKSASRSISSFLIMYIIPAPGVDCSLNIQDFWDWVMRCRHVPGLASYFLWFGFPESMPKHPRACSTHKRRGRCWRSWCTTWLQGASSTRLTLTDAYGLSCTRGAGDRKGFFPQATPG